MVRDRHWALDLIRGMAALGIAIYHWLAWNLDFRVQSIGTFGVYIFFILSALTMTMVYTKDFGSGINVGPLQSFFKNRIARLLPLLFAVASASFVLDLLRKADLHNSLGFALLTGSGLFSLALPGFLSNSTGAWSLGIEILFYIIAPVAILLAVNSSPKTIATVLLGSMAAQCVYISLISHLNDQNFWIYYSLPITFLPFFIAGFLIYRIGGSRETYFLIPTLLVFFLIAAFSLMSHVDVLRNIYAYLTLSILAFSAVYCANRTAITPSFQPACAFLGDISYALYLTHPFTNAVTRWAGAKLGLPTETQIALFVPAAMAVSFIIFRFFERPARDWLRGSGKRRELAPLS